MCCIFCIYVHFIKYSLHIKQYLIYNIKKIKREELILPPGRPFKWAFRIGSGAWNASMK